MCKRMKWYHLLTAYTKISSKGIKDLNEGPEIIKDLEENIGSTFCISLSIFLDQSLWAKSTKAKINQWDHIKLRSFCTVKEIINKIKKKASESEKIFANDVSDKVLISKIYIAFIQLNSKKIYRQMKKGAEDLNSHLSKKTY